MHSINFNYSFNSGLGMLAHARFINEVQLSIQLTDDFGNVESTIGEVEFLVVNIDEATESQYPVFEVLDAHSEYLARHAFIVFNPEEDDYSDQLNKHYNGDLINRNFCLIEKITILPKYRGYNIGAKAIRDIVFHYGAACGLFVVQPYPLQFEIFNDGRYDKLDLQAFNQTEKAAKKELSDYYKSIGFESVKGIKDLLFYNPALKNAKMEQIDLEESDVFKLRII